MRRRICEAASRPSMRFVPIKTCEQQGVMALHRLREAFKEERIGCINRIRGLLAEFGLVFAKSPAALRAQLADTLEDASNELSTLARLVLQRAFEHWRTLDEQLRWCDRQVVQHVRGDAAARKAARITGIGVLGASAFSAGVGDFSQFKGAHQFAAWLGVVPSQNSSGGKPSLGRITRRGDEYLRTLLIQGAKSAVMSAAKRTDLALAAGAAGTGRLAESLRGDGQQERAHPVGGDDAQRTLRSAALERKAAGQASAAGGACGTARLRGLKA